MFIKNISKHDGNLHKLLPVSLQTCPTFEMGSDLETSNSDKSHTLMCHVKCNSGLNITVNNQQTIGSSLHEKSTALETTVTLISYLENLSHLHLQRQQNRMRYQSSLSAKIHHFSTWIDDSLTLAQLT